MTTGDTDLERNDDAMSQMNRIGSSRGNSGKDLRFVALTYFQTRLSLSGAYTLIGSPETISDASISLSEVGTVMDPGTRNLIVVVAVCAVAVIAIFVNELTDSKKYTSGNCGYSVDNADSAVAKAWTCFNDTKYPNITHDKNMPKWFPQPQRPCACAASANSVQFSY